MRYLNVILAVLLYVSWPALVGAEEMPLPFSSSDMQPTRAVRPINKEVAESYSNRSLGRFTKRDSIDVAQIDGAHFGDEFPTEYMQDPELGQRVAVESDDSANVEAESDDQPADIPPAPYAELEDAPPAPSADEIQQMFGDRAASAATTDAAPVVEAMEAPQVLSVHQPPINLKFAAPVQPAISPTWSNRSNSSCTQ